MQFSMIRCLSLSHRHFYQGGSWLKEVMEKVLACQGQSWKMLQRLQSKTLGGGEMVMMSIGEYGKSIGVKIETFDGDFYVSLRDYEKLLKEVKELREKDDVLSEKNERK